MSFSKTTILLVLAVLILAAPAMAGRVSLLVKGSKAALKAGATEAAEDAAKKTFIKRTEVLAARYGRQSINRATGSANKLAIHPKTMLRMLEDHGDVLARHGFSDEALQFAHKHGGSGIYFLRHEALFNGLKKSTDIATVDHKVIVQAWRWGDEKAIGGSLGRLRDSLTKAGMVRDTSRDFCEDLFIVKARTGKIPGIPKGSELIKGHIGDSRQGVDMFLPENGKLRAIEFGTGIKPISGEMAWDRIRANLADYLEKQTVDGRVNLRGQGFPNELILDPKRIRSLDFPIEKFVQREVFAPQINKAEVARSGDVIARQLK